LRRGDDDARVCRSCLKRGETEGVNNGVSDGVGTTTATTLNNAKVLDIGGGSGNSSSVKRGGRVEERRLGSGYDSITEGEEGEGEGET